MRHTLALAATPPPPSRAPVLLRFPDGERRPPSRVRYLPVI